MSDNVLPCVTMTSVPSSKCRRWHTGTYELPCASAGHFCCWPTTMYEENLAKYWGKPE